MPTHPERPAPKSSLLERALLGWIASAVALVAWKVLDTPIQRQLARQISPEVLRHLEVVTEVAIIAGLAVSTGILLAQAYRAKRGGIRHRFPRL